MRQGSGAVGFQAVRLILIILFRTVLALLSLIAVAVVFLRVLDRGGRADRIEWATKGRRMVWVESRRGWLGLVVASRWPESRALRWYGGASTWPDNPYGIVIVTREQLWGDRWRTDVERGRAYALIGSDVTTWRRSPQWWRSPQVQFVKASVRYNLGYVRRLGRIPLTALTALSLILFAATVALWVRSYWTADQFWPRGYLVVSEAGAIYAIRTTIDGERGPPFWETVEAGKLGVIEHEAGERVRRTRPLRFIRQPSPSPTPIWLVIVADWFLVVLLAALPSYRIVRRLRRPPPGRCADCGDDLRATPERCPECGTATSRISR
jgi:hypothetical protein